MKKVGIAILGLGVVGSGTYQLLETHREFYMKTQKVELTVECVLELDREKALALGVPAEKICSNIAEVVADPDVNIVVETIGGTGAAREYVLAALSAGKTVVTSNKELVCKHAHELEHTARRQNAGLYFEACCAGGVPVVRCLTDSLQANAVTSIVGILNGTTNYILTEMSRGTAYKDALAEAQRLGYAESDPTADVEGYDASYKLSILASLAFHTDVPLSKVYREGISLVPAEDVRLGRELGYTLKLLAVGKKTEAGVEARVHPAFVRNNHPLASVCGADNALCITGDAAGNIMLEGKGAGSLPTGSAVVSDILYAATHPEPRYFFPENGGKEDKALNEDFCSAYYLRLIIQDKPGMLAKIGSALGKAGVSVAEVVRCGDAEGGASVVLVTGETRESAILNAAERLASSGIAKICSQLRVIA